MLFNTPQFAVFLVGVTVCHFLLPRRARWLLLLAASYGFYGCWSWQHVPLLFGVTAAGFAAGQGIVHCRRRAAKRAWLTLGLAAGFLPLLIFKYAGFVSRSIHTALPTADTGPNALWNLVLPVGISFFTFQAVGYAIDVYRDESQVTSDFGRFALFVSFFPQLVAGPIERANHLLGQFKRPRDLDWNRLGPGLELILWGLFKKAVIADRLSRYVDRIYADPAGYSGPTLLVATYFFAFQIFCDFSGYSDIAVGAAGILGYDLMDNFRQPYLATSLRDFWRRWHISLSTWFRDYLYLPLGGSRQTAARIFLNVMIVFTLSGLWHGANWTFVAWGALHGLGYWLERQLPKKCLDTAASSLTRRTINRGIRRLLTFHFVLVAWIFFRARSLSDAVLILRRLFSDAFGGLYLGPSHVTMALAGGLIAVLMAAESMREHGLLGVGARNCTWPRSVRWCIYLVLVLTVCILGVGGNAFIYFQF